MELLAAAVLHAAQVRVDAQALPAVLSVQKERVAAVPPVARANVDVKLIIASGAVVDVQSKLVLAELGGALARARIFPAHILLGLRKDVEANPDGATASHCSMSSGGLRMTRHSAPCGIR